MPTTAVLLWLSLSLTAAAPAAARVWTDKSGTHKVEADLVRVEDAQVHLRKPDGTVVVVPIDRLSDADRRHLQSLAKPAPRSERPAPAKKPATGGADPGGDVQRRPRGHRTGTGQTHQGRFRADAAGPGLDLSGGIPPTFDPAGPQGAG